jgi:hypothetical protein
MRATRLAEAANERSFVGLQEDEYWIEIAHGPQPPKDCGEFSQELAFPYVDHHSRTRDLGAGTERQLREHR